MKEEVAIRVSGLSKRYEIGKAKDGSLRGTLSSLFKSSAAQKDEFWALKDVNFEVKKGEVIGIIGKNGAGKSTLLKILSQITKPTEGRIEINGRVASLLEVGTGFHPELTGRENVYLNGTILGMTRKEVESKFDEIVAFSGVEKFIDTPVKHYSSGMYVRLAFAVAAHLEPEILIIDEVLAVGDAEFQKKCLGKMKDVAGEGRTVLFVSHNMAALEGLCTKGFLLKGGHVIGEGATKSVIDQYINLGSESFHLDLGSVINRKGNQKKQFLSAEWHGEGASTVNKIKSLRNIILRVKMSDEVDLNMSRIDVGINNSRGDRVAWLSTDMLKAKPESKTLFDFEIDNFNLSPGVYNCNFFFQEKNELVDWIQNQFQFEVINSDYFGVGRSFPENQGNILFNYRLK
ncbi:ABC transporter ATP-binding protein [Lishizhenia tianjinensis]|nr:ABC transporter ATP-binding protein [Lishizhenia tianjinensis]